MTTVQSDNHGRIISGRKAGADKSDNTICTWETGDPYPETDTDWAAIDALTDEEVAAAALSDPDCQPIPCGTDEELAKIGLHRIVNVGKLRKRLEMTQDAFAARYRIPVGTLRVWEQGRKMPHAPARAYLLVIEKDPETVAGLLGSAA